MCIYEMTPKEILDEINSSSPSIKKLDWQGEPTSFNGLLIVPTGELHGSGWMCMAFIALEGDEPVGYFNYGSDVVNMDGIGGYGRWNSTKGIPAMVEPKAWSLDMTPGGCARLFANRSGYKLRGEGLSTFELYADKIKEK